MPRVVANHIRPSRDSASDGSGILFLRRAREVHRVRRSVRRKQGSWGRAATGRDSAAQTWVMPENPFIQRSPVPGFRSPRRLCRADPGFSSPEGKNGPCEAVRLHRIRRARRGHPGPRLRCSETPRVPLGEGEAVVTASVPFDHVVGEASNAHFLHRRRSWRPRYWASCPAHRFVLAPGALREMVVSARRSVDP